MHADLVVADAELIATVDERRRELKGGWVSVNDGLISGVGTANDPEPTGLRRISARGCLVTPGLINTHHHLFQNLTRAYPPMTSAPLFGWLESLYPIWASLDEEASYVSAWVGLAELALGGCTTSTDHLYLHPKDADFLIDAEIEASTDLGFRFHPTHGSMSVSVKDGGLPPDSVVRYEEAILAESERLISKHHDRSHGAMIRIALAPCSPFSVSPELMVATAELAERLDVRLHTHLAENAEDDEYSMAQFGRRCVDQFDHTGWCTDRSWVAHCVRPNDAEITVLGRAGVGVAHCPSSNLILASGIAPVTKLRAAGSPVGIGCDGSSSADAASLWLETRQALLLAKLKSGAGSMTARDALEIATRGGASCLGRSGELGEISVGAAGDLAAWRLEGPTYAGVVDDLVEGWLRCGPTSAFHTIVAGKPVVEAGQIVSPRLDEMLTWHGRLSQRFQRSA